MKALANGFARLAAVIVILITLAVSTAFVLQWVDSQSTLNGATGSSQTHTFIALDAKL